MSYRSSFDIMMKIETLYSFIPSKMQIKEQTSTFLWLPVNVKNCILVSKCQDCVMCGGTYDVPLEVGLLFYTYK